MNIDTLFEHFDSLIELPGSIEKLRTMVLELAFSGKLTERTNRTDGEKIVEWDRTTVGAAAVALHPGFACSKQHQMPSGHVHLRTHNVATNGRLNFDTLIRVDPLRIDAARASLKAGDVIFNNTNSQELVGKTCFVDADYDFGFSNHLTLIRLSAAFDPRFFVFYFNLLWRRGFFAGLCNRWIGQAGINTKALAQIEIPAPPLAEQRRIVAKVDQLMALCDELEARQERKREGRERLVESSLAKLLAARDPAEFATCWQSVHEHFDALIEVRTSVSRLRQVILELAVRGRLSAFVDASEGSSQSSDVGLLYNLPVTWKWHRLHGVITLMDSGWSPNCPDEVTRDEDEWGVLKTTAVQNLHFDATAHKRLPGGLVPRPVAAVKQGDILITRAGPKNRVGIACFVGKVRPRLMISDKIIRFHPKGDVILPQFLAICLNAGVSREYLESAKSGMAASQVNISQEKLRNTPIPVPPISEQARLVKECDRFTELCDRLEANVDLLESGSERLLATCIESLKSVFSNKKAGV